MHVRTCTVSTIRSCPSPPVRPHARGRTGGGLHSPPAVCVQYDLDRHGFKFDPRDFQAVLSCVKLETQWRYAFSSAATYWRLSDTQEQFHGGASSSARNKLAEALQLLGLDRTGFKV